MRAINIRGNSNPRLKVVATEWGILPSEEVCSTMLGVKGRVQVLSIRRHFVGMTMATLAGDFLWGETFAGFVWRSIVLPSMNHSDSTPVLHFGISLFNLLLHERKRSTI